MTRPLIVVAALSLAPVAVMAGTVTVDAAAQARAGLSVRPVEERSFTDRLRVVGQVVRAPGTTVTVKAILPGRVETLHVAPGDRVRAGQVLVELHSHELLAIQGQLLRSAEELRLARSRLEAGRALFALEGISRQELELREQAEFSAQLDLNAAREELVDLGVAPGTVDGLLEERTTDPHLPVRTPVDGVVLEVAVQQHEWLQGYAPLAVVGDPSRAELELQLPPDEAARAGEGDPVVFSAVGRPGSTARATVVSRVPQVDPTTRTVRVRARIDDEAPGLYPGVFVEGTLTHGESRRSPFVPESAVIRVGAEDVVFVRTGATAFAARGVRLGLLDGGSYEVSDGLEVGEEVVVEGVFFLKSALAAAEGEDG